MKQKSVLLMLTFFLMAGIAIGLVINTQTNWANHSYALDSESARNAMSSEQFSVGENSGKIFAKIAKEITPTVVTITSEKKATVGGGFDEIFKKFHKNIPETGIGSGVIVRTDGYIITNDHVVRDAERIQVKLSDRRILDAELVGSDPLTDIAVIKVKSDKLPVAKFGNSDLVEVGEWVLAIGSPLSLNSTVTAGIISAKGRQIDIIGDQYGVENFIQTDAVINPGNSGGALVNTNGELIGINTAIATTTGLYQGYGFAVPINIARSVVESLIQYGQVLRGYIGVGIKDVDATYAKAVGLDRAQGVLVESLTENGAAHDAGIQEGDVILEIDGRALEQRSDLQAYIAQKKPGDKVTLLVYHNGAKATKVVILKSKDGKTTVPVINSIPDSEKQKNGEIGNGMGFEVEEMMDDTGSEPSVRVVRTSSKAEEQQIYEGFIITRINDKTVHSLKDYQNEVGKLKNGDAVVIHLAATKNGSKIITAVEVKK
ncbi:trypsin-like peptidase domain-containing protein [bacterium]|nr:trypsin-like peptidase domain-containing protein [bacterium]